ncbi:hypothetical protein BC629DRAFT_1577593 [Irpex lacteus]|nr:hypothetical protein BC629DRAFT_1577593 [Irpex lacteus]
MFWIPWPSTSAWLDTQVGGWQKYNDFFVLLSSFKHAFTNQHRTLLIPTLLATLLCPLAPLGPPTHDNDSFLAAAAATTAAWFLVLGLRRTAGLIAHIVFSRDIVERVFVINDL